MEPVRILLIDDEESVLRALSLLLNALGHSVVSHNVPEDAVAYLQSNPAEKLDLVICDLRMPGMNGLEVLSTVRDLQPDLPFVLVSGHATEEDVSKAEELGASGFLSKPFSGPQLTELIGNLASREPAAASASSNDSH